MQNLENEVRILIQDLDFSDEKKEDWLNRLEREGISDRFFEELYIEHLAFLEEKMKQAGLLEGETYQKAKQKLEDDIETLKRDFVADMDGLDKKIDAFEDTVDRDIAVEQIGKIKSKIE